MADFEAYERRASEAEQQIQELQKKISQLETLVRIEIYLFCFVLIHQVVPRENQKA